MIKSKSQKKQKEVRSRWQKVNRSAMGLVEVLGPIVAEAAARLPARQVEVTIGKNSFLLEVGSLFGR